MRGKHLCVIIVATAALLLAPAISHALINPRFTPVDLAKVVQSVARVTVRLLDADTKLQVIFDRAVIGEATSDKLVLDVPAAVRDDLARVLGKSPRQALLLLGDVAGAREGRGEVVHSQVGAVLIGTHWFGLSPSTDADYMLVADTCRLDEVWAGGDETLERLLRQLSADPLLSVPATVGVSWGRHLKVSELPGGVSQCMPILLLGSDLPALFVASPSGDRLYGWKQASMVDLGAGLNLKTHSKLAAWGDFDGDGMLDLASWDGEQLRILLRGRDGRFQSETEIVVRECASLSTIDLGNGKGSGLLLSTVSGPVLASLTEGRIKIESLRAPEANVAPTGPCEVVDVDADGLADVIQACREGLLVYRCQAPGKFAPPTWALREPLGEVRTLSLGDYDNDSLVDVLVVGPDSACLLAGTADGKFRNVHEASGEIAYHLKKELAGAVSCDINTDGREDLIFLYDRMAPQIFFSRGQRCFGLAADLALSGAGARQADIFGESGNAQPNVGPHAARGQTAAAVADFDGDGAADLALACSDRQLWVVFGDAPRQQPLLLTAALPVGAGGPLGIVATTDRRELGMRVARPGQPVTFSAQVKGPVTLKWQVSPGAQQQLKVVVLKPTRIRLPGSEEASQ